MPQFTGHCCIKCIYLSPFWSSSSVEPLPGVLQLLRNSSPWHFFWLTKGASAFCHFRKVACAFLGGFWKAAQRLLLKAAEFLIFLKSCNLPPGLWSWVWHGSLLKSNNWSGGSTSMEFLKNWCWTLCFWMHKFQHSDHVWHMYLHLQWATPAILLCLFFFVFASGWILFCNLIMFPNHCLSLNLSYGPPGFDWPEKKLILFTEENQFYSSN